MRADVARQPSSQMVSEVSLMKRSDCFSGDCGALSALEKMMRGPSGDNEMDSAVLL